MKQSRFFLILTALLLVVLGAVCIVNPKECFETMAWLVGLLILIAGATTLLFSMKARNVLPNTSTTIFLGIFQLFIGVMFLGNMLLAAETLIVLFSVWVMFEGVSLSVLAFDYKKAGFPHWWTMLLLGVCSIVLGFLAMRKPDVTSALFGVLLGLGILANGIIRLVAFFALKRIDSRLRDLKESAEATPIDNQQ